MLNEDSCSWSPFSTASEQTNAKSAAYASWYRCSYPTAVTFTRIWWLIEWVFPVSSRKFLRKLEISKGRLKNDSVTAHALRAS